MFFIRKTKPRTKAAVAALPNMLPNGPMNVPLDPPPVALTSELSRATSDLKGLGNKKLENVQIKAAKPNVENAPVKKGIGRRRKPKAVESDTLANVAPVTKTLKRKAGKLDDKELRKPAKALRAVQRKEPLHSSDPQISGPGSDQQLKSPEFGAVPIQVMDPFAFHSSVLPDNSNYQHPFLPLAVEDGIPSRPSKIRSDNANEPVMHPPSGTLEAMDSKIIFSGHPPATSVEQLWLPNVDEVRFTTQISAAPGAEPSNISSPTTNSISDVRANDSLPVPSRQGDHRISAPSSQGKTSSRKVKTLTGLAKSGTHSEGGVPSTLESEAKRKRTRNETVNLISKNPTSPRPSDHPMNVLTGTKDIFTADNAGLRTPATRLTRQRRKALSTARKNEVPLQEDLTGQQIIDVPLVNSTSKSRRRNITRVPLENTILQPATPTDRRISVTMHATPCPSDILPSTPQIKHKSLKKGQTPTETRGMVTKVSYPNNPMERPFENEFSGSGLPVMDMKPEDVNQSIFAIPQETITPKRNRTNRRQGVPLSQKKRGKGKKSKGTRSNSKVLESNKNSLVGDSIPSCSPVAADWNKEIRDDCFTAMEVTPIVCSTHTFSCCLFTIVGANTFIILVPTDRCVIFCRLMNLCALNCSSAFKCLMLDTIPVSR
jgi:hypothetical protein